MDYLEDWNLWCRYAIIHEFTYVPKTTSMYRTPFLETERKTAAIYRYDANRYFCLGTECTIQQDQDNIDQQSFMHYITGN